MKVPTRATFLFMALLLSPYVPAQDFPPSAKDALKLVYEGRYGDALPLVEAELAKLPKNVALLHLRAVCKGKLGRHEEAIADASAAIELDPRHAGSYGERAYNLFQSGKVDQALADYDKSVELDPKNPMVHGERGDALLELGRYRDAMSAYDEASRLVPKWPNPHSQRGRAATSLADFEAAHVSFARAVELAPDDLFSRFCLAGAQFDCRLDDEALDTARRLSRRSPDSYSIALRGRLAWQLDRYELAREELAKAAGRGKPGERLDAQLSLGILLLAQGESQAALDGMPYDEALQKTETLAPWLSLTRWCARYALGLRDEADASLTAELAACSEVDDEVRELADLLTGEAPVTSFETPDGEHAAESCPALFFAGWRALIDGKEARADELLLQCVETGAKQYMQWQAARTVLLRRHGVDAFVVSIGAAFEAQKIDDRDLLVVTSVLDKPPGAALWQGLEVGDVLLRVSDAPYDAAAIERTWSTKRVGHDVHLTIRRDGEESVVMLRLGWQRR